MTRQEIEELIQKLDLALQMKVNAEKSNIMGIVLTDAQKLKLNTDSEAICEEVKTKLKEVKGV